MVQKRSITLSSLRKQRKYGEILILTFVNDNSKHQIQNVSSPKIWLFNSFVDSILVHTGFLMTNL